MDNETVLLAHGGGGRLTHELIDRVFLPRLDSPVLREQGDSAVLNIPGLNDGSRIALTTDTYVVRPLFFPGGDIGRLAVCGTVNDLAVAGARPLFVAAAFVIEEGVPIETLVRVAESMRVAAAEAGIQIVTGDTKVVERGSADQLFITTSGVGHVPAGVEISASRARPGDAIIVSGSIGDHGIAIVSKRSGLEMETEVESDVAPLNHLVAAMLAASADVRSIRDATRGGVAAVLNEMAKASGVTMLVDEGKLPVHAPVRAACDLLGYDPLYVANEGKFVAVVGAADAEKVVAVLRRTRYGEEAAIIGQVVAEPKGRVLLRTGIGGTRIVAMPSGELLPRIC
jgi:hydrogenase expression/formation protein HypE